MEMSRFSEPKPLVVEPTESAGEEGVIMSEEVSPQLINGYIYDECRWLGLTERTTSRSECENGQKGFSSTVLRTHDSSMCLFDVVCLNLHPTPRNHTSPGSGFPETRKVTR
jgi:hypothetical protein